MRRSGRPGELIARNTGPRIPGRKWHNSKSKPRQDLVILPYSKARAKNEAIAIVHAVSYSGGWSWSLEVLPRVATCAFAKTNMSASKLQILAELRRSDVKPLSLIAAASIVPAHPKRGGTCLDQRRCPTKLDLWLIRHPSAVEATHKAHFTNNLHDTANEVSTGSDIISGVFPGFTTESWRPHDSSWTLTPVASMKEEDELFSNGIDFYSTAFYGRAPCMTCNRDDRLCAYVYTEVQKTGETNHFYQKTLRLAELELSRGQGTDQVLQKATDGIVFLVQRLSSRAFQTGKFKMTYELQKRKLEHNQQEITELRDRLEALESGSQHATPQTWTKVAEGIR
ncbi:uncharacterized protein PpBr36_06795 [Pyricularia pennisetigena]|uniref:uncharacterized protein n=1 Tax=Pyricularia pennisetigena TaxID=1578925 RepID=UPI0011501430|nr:uncharacterized protein PpBr36_06795 [Pyricularia pennisetigena]TLS23602.1 hypothetical protein PpBr36_06795 [Pyricularia pennisetigena]